MADKPVRENEQTTKPTPADQQGKDQPGMLGDGTQEQSLNRPADKNAKVRPQQGSGSR